MDDILYMFLENVDLNCNVYAVHTVRKKRKTNRNGNHSQLI